METGLRAGELRSLTRASFDLDAEPPTVTVAAAYSKRRRDDTLILRSELAEDVRAYLCGKAPATVAFKLPKPNMIIRMFKADLEAAGIPYRDDVGRVAEIGSVNVTEKMTIEYYSHVMHIVSNVEGRLKPGLDAVDALIAGFPAGTVSGAPKVRAMEIIDELEKERRGIYAGAVGYFSASGAMDTCIALRTAIIKDGVMYVQAGGGVVADSDPKAEYQETVNKARALFRAAEEATRFAARGGS